MTETPNPPRKIKILIADDHAAFRRAFRSMFRADEADFLECSDGYEAILRFGEFRPDWAVLDFNMSPVDGLTATESIKKQFPEARVLLITLHDGDDLKDAVARAGGTAYVRKEYLIQARDIIRASPY